MLELVSVLPGGGRGGLPGRWKRRQAWLCVCVRLSFTQGGGPHTGQEDRWQAALLPRWTLNPTRGPCQAQWDPRSSGQALFPHLDACGKFPPASWSCKEKVKATGCLFKAHGFLGQGFTAREPALVRRHL